MYRDFIIPIKKRKYNQKTLETKTENWFKCLYCEREYKKESEARRCLDEHNLRLIPIAQNDLGRLNQFIYLKEDDLLTESLVRIIQKYARKIK